MSNDITTKTKGAGAAIAKHIPGKRIKTWHRREGRAQSLSLRAYARGIVANNKTDESITAKRWLAGKGLAK